jgi:DNA-binding transcriptional ArsR family regulator
MGNHCKANKRRNFSKIYRFARRHFEDRAQRNIYRSNGITFCSNSSGKMIPWITSRTIPFLSITTVTGSVSPLSKITQTQSAPLDIPELQFRSGLCALPLYALTRIYAVEHVKRMESVFEIIAEPNRRAILSLLVLSQQSVGEIERQLRMPQPTVSKHLRVLREAGFVESTVDAQRRLYRLKPEPLQEVDAWLAPFRRFWSAHVEALERHLDRMEQSTPMKSDLVEQSTPAKKKTRRRR